MCVCLYVCVGTCECVYVCVYVYIRTDGYSFLHFFFLLFWYVFLGDLNIFGTMEFDLDAFA